MAYANDKKYLYPPIRIVELRSSVRDGVAPGFGYPPVQIVELRSQVRIEESPEPEAEDSFVADIQKDRDGLKDEVKKTTTTKTTYF